MILITVANPALLSEPSPTAMPRRRGGGLTDAPPYIQTETGTAGRRRTGRLFAWAPCVNECVLYGETIIMVPCGSLLIKSAGRRKTNTASQLILSLLSGHLALLDWHSN